MSRKNNTHLMAPLEKAIHDVMVMVEEMGADVRLTECQTLLAQAKDRASAYIDELLKK